MPTSVPSKYILYLSRKKLQLQLSLVAETYVLVQLLKTVTKVSDKSCETLGFMIENNLTPSLVVTASYCCTLDGLRSLASV